MAYLNHDARNKVLKKIQHYCNYQPRTHIDVRQKLYTFKLWKKDVEELIAELIETGYLNEQRYAHHYVSQKTKQPWGRLKIKKRMKTKFISDPCIKDAFKDFDEKAYLNTLSKLATEKWNSLRGVGTNHFVKMRKTGNYLLQRGYESNLVWKELNKLKQ